MLLQCGRTEGKKPGLLTDGRLRYVLARVAAIDLVGSEGGQPVGYALAGPAAAAVGTHIFLTGSAVAMAVAGAAFAFLPALRAGQRDTAE